VATQTRAAAPGPDVIRVTVTVASKDKNPPPSVTREDVLVRQENERRPVLAWFPAQGERAGLDLTVLVDDSLSSAMGPRLAEIGDFIRARPPTTRVAVIYASQGRLNVLQDFTTDHDLAAKALRIPRGGAKYSQSIFQSVALLEEHSPPGNLRRAILLFSDGIDIFHPPTSVIETPSIDVLHAVELGQRTGITVYAIYASAASVLSRSSRAVLYGQNALTHITEETGGEAFFSGQSTPQDFKPFLQEVTNILERQYVLVFQAKLGPKPGYKRIRVTTELSGARLTAPAHVYLPASH
jgi:VWFA-related protein